MKIIRDTYYGGSFNLPQTITQKFWDELTERRKQIAEINKEASKPGARTLGCIDTTYGSDPLGERPTIPDWVYTLGWIVLFTTSFICFFVMIVIFSRGY